MSGTPGVVMILVSSGEEARELLDKLFGPTYMTRGPDDCRVFRDDADDWFEPVGYTMSTTTFFQRFVKGGK